MININNILTQLNAKMAADIADSYNIPELVKRVEAYQKLNIDAGTVPEYHSFLELPDSDSANIGQIVFVKQKPASRGDYANNVKDSAGTFFFGKRVQVLGVDTIGWQKIPMLQGDSDYSDFVTKLVYVFGGTSYGYATGGRYPSSSYQNVIDKYSYTSDANATDVGDLATAVGLQPAGQSSKTNGYNSGGSDGSSAVNHIQKFPFASDDNASDVGDLTQARYSTTGQSSETHGYTAGGDNPANSNRIDKFSFSVDGNATDVANLVSSGSDFNTGNSSPTHGYATGRNKSNTIDKFSFSVDENATDVGDLTLARGEGGGQSSSSHGYNSGGQSPPGTNLNTIDKFSFTSDGNATDVGDLSVTIYWTSGTSSTTYGYIAGGNPTPNINRIEKFPFSTDTNASDIANLTVGRWSPAGQQV